MQTNFLATPSQWRKAWQDNWTRDGLKRVRIAVAYCSHNGALEIARAQLGQNTPVQLLVGLNDGVTDEAAQLSLFEWMESKGCVEVRSYFQRGGRFHPKVYSFEFETEVRVLLGSFNLTDSAFHRNTEAAFELILTTDEAPHHEIIASLEQWWERASVIVHPDDFGAQSRQNGMEWVLVQLMRRGLFVSVEATLRELEIPFSGDLFELGDERRVESDALLVERNRRAQVFLLSKETRRSLENLQDTARRNCSALSLKCMGGRFIPSGAFAAWQRAHLEIQREFDAFVEQLMVAKRQQDERSALEKRVDEDATRIWQEFHGQGIPEDKQAEIVRQALAAFDKCAARFNELIQLRYTIRQNPFPDLWAQIEESSAGDFAAESGFVQPFDDAITMNDVVVAQVAQTHEATLREWTRALYVTPRTLAADALVQLQNPRKTWKSREKICQETVAMLDSFNFYGDRGLRRLQTYLQENESQIVSSQPQTPSLFGTEDQLKEFREQMNADLKAALEWPQMELKAVFQDFTSRVGWEGK